MILKWKLIAIAAIIAALAGTAWTWREEIEKRARYAMRGEQLEQALLEAQADAARQAELRQTAEKLAQKRSADIQTLRDQEEGLRAELRALERDDEAVAEWAGRPVPGAVLDRLRQPASAGGGENADSGGAAAE